MFMIKIKTPGWLFFIVACFSVAAYPVTGRAASCSGDTFSIVSFSDDYMMGGGSGLDNQVLQKMFGLDPNIMMIVSNGDETDIRDARQTIDGTLGSHLDCGAPEFPFFTAFGNHNLDGDDTNISWYASTYANSWSSNAPGSRLALQLPGLSNFKRGPLQVSKSSGGTASITDGGIYSFDYRNAHIAIINNFEQGGTSGDSEFGAWDVNGSGVNNPENSQIDWLKQDLASTAKPVKLVFSHVGLVAPQYPNDNTMSNAGCSQFSEHSGPFHTTELAKVLSDYNVTAIYRGHDHCPSRSLVDGNRNTLFQRSYLDAYRASDRPYGNPSQWQGLLGPGKVWQVDDGSVYNNMGFFTLTKITDTTITFDTYRFDSPSGPLSLWDSFTIPIASAPSDTAPPATPSNLRVR